MILRRINPAAMTAARVAHVDDTCAWLKHAAFGAAPALPFHGLYSAVVDENTQLPAARQRPRYDSLSMHVATSVNAYHGTAV